MIVELDVFYNKLKANIKDLEAKRSYNERTIFDSKGKRLRRKLEQGYLKGLGDGIKAVDKTYKSFLKEIDCEANDGQK